MAPGPQQQRRSNSLPALFCFALLAGTACAPVQPPPPPERTAEQKAAEPKPAEPQASQVGGQGIPALTTARPRPPDGLISVTLPCPNGPVGDAPYAAHLDLYKPGRLTLLCAAQSEAARHGVAFNLAQYTMLTEILRRIEEDMFPTAEPGYETRMAAAMTAQPKLAAPSLDTVFQRLADSWVVSVDGTWQSQASLNARNTFGLVLSRDKVDDVVRISEVLDDTPAAKAGLTFGVQVLRVGDQAAKDFRLPGVDFQPAPLVITYRAADGSTQSVSLPSEPRPRARNTQSRATLALKDNIAHITLSNFGADAGRHLATELAKEPYREARGYVLDLRNNLGGLLDQVVAVADVFLDRGEVGRLRGRPGSDINNSIYNARTGDLARGKPLVVLTNRFTGSGAEMAAAALADNNRATLIGETTAGLLRIETIFPIGSLSTNADLRGLMRIRTATVLRPNGAAIDGPGVAPAIAVADNRIKEGAEAPDRIMDRALVEIRRLIGQ